MKDSPLNIKQLAAIEYHGRSGDTESCLNAIARLIQFGNRIHKAYLLSNIESELGFGQHCYLLTIDYGEHIAIKSGFSSGYSGQGPSGLSKSLQMLIRHHVEIEEYEVNEDFIYQLDQSCLLISDLDSFKSMRPVRPKRYYDYILLEGGDKVFDNNKIQSLFPEVVPYSVLDQRLIDLAIKFVDAPDQTLMTAYRRMEDVIRERSNFTGGSGSRLFSSVFQGNDAVLHWPKIPESETKGRVALFTGAYMAYRNRRAHKETDDDLKSALREFLLINQLFILESEAKEIDRTGEAQKEKSQILGSG